MAPISNAREWYQPPPAQPVQRGLFSVAEVVDVSDPHLLLGAEYQTDLCVCEPVQHRTDQCSSVPLVDDHLSTVTGDPVTVEQVIACTQTEAESAYMRQLLEQGIAARAEPVIADAVWEVLKDKKADTSFVNAFGLVEEGVALTFLGRGTLISSASGTTTAASFNLLEPVDGNHLSTYVGSRYAHVWPKFDTADRVAIGGFGRLTILRGPLMVVRQHNHDDQPYRMIASRTYVPIVECPFGHVLAA